MRDASRAEDLNGPGATGREAPTSNAARIVATVVKKIDDDPASGGPQTGYSRARFRGLGARLGVNEEGQEALVLEHAPLRGREARAAWCGAPDSHPSWTSKTARIFIVVGQSASFVSGHQRQLARAPNPATSYAPARADARAESRTVRRDEDESPRSPSRPLRARVARTVPIRVPRVPASRTPRTRHPHARCRRIFGDEG